MEKEYNLSKKAWLCGLFPNLSWASLALRVSESLEAIQPYLTQAKCWNTSSSSCRVNLMFWKKQRNTLRLISQSHAKDIFFVLQNINAESNYIQWLLSIMINTVSNPFKPDHENTQRGGLLMKSSKDALDAKPFCRICTASKMPLKSSCSKTLGSAEWLGINIIKYT